MAQVTKGSKREATWAATRKLREKYPEDWRELLAAEYRARGIPVPPTSKERADERLRKILAEYPDLGEKYNLGPATAVDEVAESDPAGSPRQNVESDPVDSVRQFADAAKGRSAKR